MSTQMEKLVALARRRGFIFQSSEIYGGINGFWDYGPLGTLLKRNLKEAWWKDIVQMPTTGPNNALVDIVGLDSTIIMNPKVWVASGHASGFCDPMVDCRETKARYRADHLICQKFSIEKQGHIEISGYIAVTDGDDIHARLKKKLDKLSKQHQGGKFLIEDTLIPYTELTTDEQRNVIGPDTEKMSTLTEPRQFNLMFKTYVGALEDQSALAYLRPETAQGIFVNFKNVLDTSRVKVPFGIAQIGKAFRNEVTPRHFTFRSREFEQMEIEFFTAPEDAHAWYEFWTKRRYEWWLSLGISSANLRLRAQDKDELAHYAKEGAGSSDIEYRFPFTDPGFGELEGIAHRTDFDLRQHAIESKMNDRLKYFDQDKKIHYFPHVIEPSAGADRGVLALLCEAYTEDPSRASGVYMKFHPRIAPIKAAVFPLVDKDGLTEIAEKLYLQLRKHWMVDFDEKQSIGKRYARMDEAGTPYCFTVDTQTKEDNTVTVRFRDSLQQQRISIDQVYNFLKDHIDNI